MHSNPKNLEQLLESLIKMVGKSNQNVDSLKVRVKQLENLIREHQLVLNEQDNLPINPRPSHSPAQDMLNTH